MREIVTPEFFPFHVLDQDGDALVIVRQIVLMTVQERIRIDAAGIYAGNGVCQGEQVFFQRALIGTEDAFIFSRKGGAKIIL